MIKKDLLGNEKMDIGKGLHIQYIPQRRRRIHCKQYENFT